MLKPKHVPEANPSALIVALFKFNEITIHGWPPTWAIARTIARRLNFVSVRTIKG
jgi:hypothetical protein